MTPEELNRALERLRAHAHEDAVTVWLQPDAHGAPLIVLTKPLAALIEAAARPLDVDDYSECRCCGSVTTYPFQSGVTYHQPDCALVALVRAINGGAA